MCAKDVRILERVQMSLGRKGFSLINTFRLFNTNNNSQQRENIFYSLSYILRQLNTKRLALFIVQRQISGGDKREIKRKRNKKRKKR